MAITDKQRVQAETLVYEVMDKLDKTKTNSGYYKNLFSSLSNEQFEKLFKQEFPLKFHMRPFEIEPTMKDIENALKVMKVPLTEKVYLPHKYMSPTKGAVNSKETLVGYIYIKKMKQMITKKNAMSTNISKRDMKTGLLLDYDKNGKSSDRELENMLVLGLKDTVDEFARPKADAMESKNKMYNMINTTGDVSLKDIPIDEDDSLAKNLMNTYFIGAHLYTNLINKEYYLPYTLNKIGQRKAVSRI